MPTQPPALTDAQIEHFNTFGFIVRRQLFSAQEITRINQEFAVGLEHTLEQNKTALGERGQFNWSNMNQRAPYLLSLMEDPRICTAAEQLLGENVFGFAANSNLFNGDRTEWHPDLDSPHLKGAKFLLYTTPVDGNTGALRVLPGSHRKEFGSELQRIRLKGDVNDTTSPFLKASNLGINDIPAYICATEPGDMITFDYRLWHASWAGTAGRRMVSFNFYTMPQTPEEHQAMQELVDVYQEIRDDFFPDPPNYSWWEENALQRSTVRSWLDAIDACGLK